MKESLSPDKAICHLYCDLFIVTGKQARNAARQCHRSRGIRVTKKVTINNSSLSNAQDWPKTSDGLSEA